VPIKSILGFLLSMSAALGAQVAMFQWGWGEHILGVTKSETISFLPIIMLAIIFGLSSDYEVFVVSRIKEDFTKTGDARGAVERGTGLSARVVTAAALIIVSRSSSRSYGEQGPDHPGDRVQLRRRRLPSTPSSCRLTLVSQRSWRSCGPSSGITRSGSPSTCPTPTSRASASNIRLAAARETATPQAPS